jgi:hypothetical protein
MRPDKVALLRDGLKARQLLDSGMRPRDVLLVIGGSRARMYRALLAISKSETGFTVSEKIYLQPK